LGIAEQNEIIKWRAHPAREHPGRAAIGVVIIAGLAAAAFLSFGIFWSIAAAAALIVSLNRFFFPSEFTIDQNGIRSRELLRRKLLRWSDVRRFAHDANGGFLSRRSRPSWTDSHAGMHILFGDRGGEIIGIIQQKLSEARSGAPDPNSVGDDQAIGRSTALHSQGGAS
jgi:hypothetical protein